MLRPTPAVELDEEFDEHSKNAVELVVRYDRASPAFLQRRLSIGYARAARLIDQLEASGVIGPAEGAMLREVLIRSAEEVLGDNSNQSNTKRDDVFEVPANYKVPTNVKLSRVDNPPWGKQFSDVFKTNDLKDSKMEFPIPFGFDDKGKLKTESLLDVTNLIIAGNTLSQKENFVDTILLTYLLRYDPVELKIILIDPAHYLDLYDGIAQLLSPVIHDYDKFVSALKWAQAEMERRLKQFSEACIRDINAFNEKSNFVALPRILIVSFCELFGVEIEDSLLRLTAQGVRTGIHNIIVVDRTSGASLPGSIKSNVPARAVFRLTSAVESRAIDVSGAEKLQAGEIIYKPNFGAAVKLNAVFTPETNIKHIVMAVRKIST